MSRLPQGTGVRSRSGVCVRKCSGNSEDLQFPHQQNDFASRDSEGTGAQTPGLWQNRSPPEIYLEKRASVLSSFETRERQSRFRIHRKNAATKKIACETSDDRSVIRPRRRWRAPCGEGEKKTAGNSLPRGLRSLARFYSFTQYCYSCSEVCIFSRGQPAPSEHLVPPLSHRLPTEQRPSLPRGCGRGSNLWTDPDHNYGKRRRHLCADE